jgi:hypothetical protein
MYNEKKSYRRKCQPINENNRKRRKYRENNGINISVAESENNGVMESS